MKTKTYKTIISAMVAAFMLTSCSDWFDVMPRTSVYEEDIYAREAGYQKVLTGLYSAMGKTNLYGKQASYGLLDVVGNLWYIPKTTNDAYKYAYQYNYEYSDTKSAIAGIWDEAYNVIANANELLRNAGIVQHADSANTAGRTPSEVFVSEQTRDLITGEALAVRAYIHFDLLRMFGMSPAVDANKLSIPYVTTLKKEVTPQSTVSEVLRKVKTDLLQAESLMRATDPVVKSNPQPAGDDWYRRSLRTTHVNYYAVCGLLARVCQYAGEDDEAGTWAEKVIDSGVFEWTKAEAVNNGDYLGTAELVFNVFVRDMKDRITTDFKSQDGDYSGANVLGLSNEVYQDWYAGNDRRTKGFLYLVSKRVPQKYVVTKDEVADTAQLRCRIPMIRLSEMYYIASEKYLAAGNIDEASKMLNVVRKARGLKNQEFTVNNIREELDDEYRREFVGEGQLFYYIKRRNQPSLILSQFVVDFVFPLPENEYTYANREPNK